VRGLRGWRLAFVPLCGSGNPTDLGFASGSDVSGRRPMRVFFSSPDSGPPDGGGGCLVGFGSASGGAEADASGTPRGRLQVGADG